MELVCEFVNVRFCVRGTKEGSQSNTMQQSNGANLS